MTCIQDFDAVAKNIKIARKNQIEALHKFIFEYEGDKNNRQRIRAFTGFDYTKDYQQLIDKCDYINGNLTTADLMSVCFILRLNHEHKERILHIFENLRRGQLFNSNNEDDDENAESNDENDESNDENVGENDQDQCSVSETSEKTGGTSHSIVDRSRSVTRNHAVRETPNFAMSCRDLEGTIRDYDGTNNMRIETWIQEFEETACIMGWNEFQKFIFAKKSLKGLARLFILGGTGIRSWSKLKNALLLEFSQKVNSAQIHEMLLKRKMKRDETVQEYFYNMKDLASQGKIEDDALITYLINGIENMNIVILYGAANIREFKRKLRDYDKLEEEDKKRPIFKHIRKTR